MAKKRTMRNYLENEGLKLFIWVSKELYRIGYSYIILFSLPLQNL